MENKSYARYGITDGLFFAWCAVFTGFITTYFLKSGLSASGLSSMLAIYMGACFLGALFFGRLCDRLKTNKKVFLTAFGLVVALGAFICMITPVNVKLASMLYPVLGFLLSSLGSNLDAWMLRSFHKDGAIYGKARAMGSLGYALSALLAGQVISRFGYGMIQILQIIFGALTIAMAVNLKELPFENEANEKQESKGNVKLLFKSPIYLVLLVVLFFGGLAISPVNNMKTLFIQETGGDVSMLGLDSFLGVTLQAVLIFVSGKFTKLPVKVRLLLMSLASFADLLLVYTATSPYMVIMGTLFWNVSFSIMLPTQREIVEKNVDPSVRNMAHNLGDTAYNNFSAIIALSYSSNLIDVFGVKSIALVGAVIMLVPIVMEFYLLFKKSDEKKAVSVQLRPVIEK